MTNELYEKLAEQFYKETGMLAPGKDVPPELGNDSKPYGVRRAEWERWRSDLSEGQRKRMEYAVLITTESMFLCGVPRDVQARELEKLAIELLVRMKVDKEEYPTASIEEKWRRRELNYWIYSNRHLLKDCEV